jgi:hypothetical protein
MKTYTLTELKKDTNIVLEQMAVDGYTLITQNGKPKTMMFDVEDADIEQSIAELRWLRARQSVGSMRSKAQSNGFDNLKMSDIDEIIAHSRKGK